MRSINLAISIIGHKSIHTSAPAPEFVSWPYKIAHWHTSNQLKGRSLLFADAGTGTKAQPDMSVLCILCSVSKFRKRLKCTPQAFQNPNVFCGPSLHARPEKQAATHLRVKVYNKTNSDYVDQFTTAVVLSLIHI